MRRATLAILTYLSLLASIGSFMISAVPFLAELRPAVEQARTELHQMQRVSEPLRAPEAGRRDIERAPAQAVEPTRGLRDAVVHICILTIFVCAVGLLMIRLLRPRGAIPGGTRR